MYNDFILPSGNQVFHCLGVMLTAPGGARTGIGVQRQRSQAAFSDDDERQLQALQPHLSRMAGARWRIRQLGEKLLFAEAQAAHSADVTFLIDRIGRVLWSSAAESDANDMPIGRSRDGRMICYRSEDAEAFRKALREATSSSPAGHTISMCALDGSDRWWVSVDSHEPARGTALVRVRDRQMHAHRQAQRAKSAFNLSTAETALGQALLRGTTLENYAAHRGVGISTVRAQLSAILLKSGMDRQASFVALASSLPC
jgi:hypothetical protein